LLAVVAKQAANCDLDSINSASTAANEVQMKIAEKI